MELMSPEDELAELLELPRRSRRFAIPRIPLPRLRRPNLTRPRLLRLPRIRISQERRTDICFLAGLAAFAGGCGWIFPPAWPIVGGFFLAAVAWLEQRGRAVDPQLRDPAVVIERFGPSDDGDEVD